MNAWEKYNHWFKSLGSAIQSVFIWGSIALSVWAYVEVGPNGVTAFLFIYSCIHSMIVAD